MWTRLATGVTAGSAVSVHAKRGNRNLSSAHNLRRRHRALYSCLSEIVKFTTVGSLGFTFTFFVQLTGVLYIGRRTSTCAPTSRTFASDTICQPPCQATISYSPGGTSEST